MCLKIKTYQAHFWFALCDIILNNYINSGWYYPKVIKSILGCDMTNLRSYRFNGKNFSEDS